MKPEKYDCEAAPISFEKFFDHVPLISQTNDEVREAVMAIDLHDVPEDWPAADLHHRFVPGAGFFDASGSKATSRNHHFQQTVPFSMGPNAI